MPARKIGSSMNRTRYCLAARLKRCCGRCQTKSHRKCEKQTSWGVRASEVDRKACDVEVERSIIARSFFKTCCHERTWQVRGICCSWWTRRRKRPTQRDQCINAFGECL